MLARLDLLASKSKNRGTIRRVLKRRISALLRSYICLAASGIAAQLYLPKGKWYCYAVVFALRRVVLLRSCICLAASGIAMRLYLPDGKWYSENAFFDKAFL